MIDDRLPEVSLGSWDAVIYRFVFQLMHRLTLGQAALLVVLAVLYLLFMWSRSRDQRRW